MPTPSSVDVGLRPLTAISAASSGTNSPRAANAPLISERVSRSAPCDLMACSLRRRQPASTRFLAAPESGARRRQPRASHILVAGSSHQHGVARDAHVVEKELALVQRPRSQLV